DQLGEHEALIVLDNCEHMVEECASLVDTILRAIPHLRVLATSRQALGLAYEATLLVPPLSLPEAGQPASVEEVSRYEAVRLFVERARLRHADFELSGENASTVTRICRRLDGIPLAIELAAARVRVLSPEEIAQHLDESLRLLAASGQTVARHKTLAALMDWSYNL